MKRGCNATVAGPTVWPNSQEIIIIIAMLIVIVMIIIVRLVLADNLTQFWAKAVVSRDLSSRLQFLNFRLDFCFALQQMPLDFLDFCLLATEQMPLDSGFLDFCFALQQIPLDFCNSASLQQNRCRWKGDWETKGSAGNSPNLYHSFQLERHGDGDTVLQCLICNFSSVSVSLSQW